MAKLLPELLFLIVISAPAFLIRIISKFFKGITRAALVLLIIYFALEIVLFVHSLIR